MPAFYDEKEPRLPERRNKTAESTFRKPVKKSQSELFILKTKKELKKMDKLVNEKPRTNFSQNTFMKSVLGAGGSSSMQAIKGAKIFEEPQYLRNLKLLRREAKRVEMQLEMDQKQQVADFARKETES